MKKGFTLMEILAVLLVIAVVVSMAVPIFRSVRYEVNNGKAKTAAKELAEAVRSYYQISRGLGIRQECFTPSTSAGNSVLMQDPTTCENPAADGIPYQNSSVNNSSRPSVSQLFACGYVPYKDFLKIPYEFCVCNPVAGQAQPSECQIEKSNSPFVVVRGVTGAGEKYMDEEYYIYVEQDMKVKDSAK